MLDGIQNSPYQEKPRIPEKKSRVRLGFALLMLTLLVLGIFVGSRLVLLAQKVLEGENGSISFRELFLAEDKQLIGEDQGLVRLLLLGIGGEKHEGGTLTDTMILATLKLPQNKNETPQVGLVSIPRDLTVWIPGYEYRKINTAHAYGEVGGKRLGPSMAISAVEELLDVKIPYYGLIDFQGFQKIIDDLGGVEVTVETGFTDNQFPDNRNGYLPPLSFETGPQKMNGQRALQFVRSRHGNNNQGSDFARAHRQQLVLKAVRDKVTNVRVLTNLSLVDRLLQDLGDHVRTNLALHELKRLYSLLKNIESQNIRSLTIDGQGGLVCDQIVEETGAYILLPCRGLGKYEDIRSAVANQFLIGPLHDEQARIEIQNASQISFLSQRALSFVNQSGLIFTTTNFKGQTHFQQSIIYDNTGGKKPETLTYLKTKLGIIVAQSPFPFSTVAPNPDFVIIVTSDLDSKLP